MYHYLKSDKLRVELTSPGTPPNDYFRFDRTGFISEVTLYDGTRFCASEPRNLKHPSSNGRGFCSCYRFDTSMEVAKGAYFPILGVGLLKKPDEDKYSQFLRYDDGFIPFQIQRKFTEDTAEYEVLPLPCNGYAVHEYRTIAVKGDMITNRVRLENVGSKPMEIVEYCHNFISIGGMAVGPDYTIDFPQINDLSGTQQKDAERGTETNFLTNGKGFRMKQYEPGDFSVAISDYSFYKGEPFVWRVSNRAAGAYVEGRDTINLKRVKIWTCDHMVCPEIYQHISIQPGESWEWSRELRFGRT